MGVYVIREAYMEYPMKVVTSTVGVEETLCKLFGECTSNSDGTYTVPDLDYPGDTIDILVDEMIVETV